MAAISRGLTTPNLPPGVTLQRQARSVGKVAYESHPEQPSLNTRLCSSVDAVSPSVSSVYTAVLLPKCQICAEINLAWRQALASEYRHRHLRYIRIMTKVFLTDAWLCRTCRRWAAAPAGPAGAGVRRRYGCRPATAARRPGTRPRCSAPAGCRRRRWACPPRNPRQPAPRTLWSCPFHRRQRQL